MRNSVKNHRRLFTDCLFGAQILLAFLLGGSQFARMLTSTQGVSVSMFLFTDFFFCLLLYLAVMTSQKNPSRVARQTVVVYSASVAAYSLLLVTALLKCPVVWETSDSFTSSLVLTGIIAVGLVWRVKGWTLNDPYLRVGLALAFKAIPQFLLAYKIATVGRGGISGLWILSFHAFTTSRLLGLFFLNRELKWDRSRRAMLLSEIGNEASWIAVTLAWLFGKVI